MSIVILILKCAGAILLSLALLGLMNWAEAVQKGHPAKSGMRYILLSLVSLALWVVFPGQKWVYIPSFIGLWLVAWGMTSYGDTTHSDKVQG